MPKVSVIIPVYNAERYLKECLDSVLQQTLHDIEIICIDDGSTDSSWQILEDYKKRDNRVICQQQKNQGAGVARNKGLKIAKGEYLAFFDSDDVFDVKMLEHLYNLSEENSLDIAVCRSYRFDSTTKKITQLPQSIRISLLPDKKVFAGREIKKDFFKAFIWWPWDKLYKKKYIESQKLKFQALRTTNDLYFVSCAVLMAGRIAYINDVLAHHRSNVKTSLSVTRENSWNCFYLALLDVRKFLQNNDLYNQYEQDFVNYCLHLSMWHLETMTGKSYCLLYNALRKEWFKEMGVTGRNEEYFYDKSLYRMLCYILKTDIADDLNKKNKALSTIGKSRPNNIYMRVKLYYKGNGLIGTLKKILEKIREKI